MSNGQNYDKKRKNFCRNKTFQGTTAYSKLINAKHALFDN